MQSQNRLKTLFANLTQRQRTFIALFASFFCVLLLLALIATLTPNKKTQKGTSTVDQLSGEKINVIPGQNESLGESTKRPYVLGLETLVRLGLSTYQTSEVEAALYDYGIKTRSQFNRGSIDVNKITIAILGEPTTRQTTVLEAPFVIDDKKTVYMVVTYGGANDIQIQYFANKGGELLYDGGKLYGPESIDQTVD